MDRIERLRRFKEREHLSYERLARLVDVSFMSLYRWIKMGISPRNRSTIQKVDYFLHRFSEDASVNQSKKPSRRTTFTRQLEQVAKGRRKADLLAFSGHGKGW